jgi:hypothetical protein
VASATLACTDLIIPCGHRWNVAPLFLDSQDPVDVAAGAGSGASACSRVEHASNASRSSLA